MRWPWSSRKRAPMLPLFKKEESSFERENRQQREWEEQSDDPIAKRYRKWRDLSPIDMLLAMAEKEEDEEGGWCSIAGSEIEHKNWLRREGLIADSPFAFAVTFLTDYGRKRVIELREALEETTNPERIHRLKCAECGHGFMEHRGHYAGVNEREPPELEEGQERYDLIGNCRSPRCKCTTFVPPWMNCECPCHRDKTAGHDEMRCSMCGEWDPYKGMRKKKSYN